MQRGKLRGGIQFACSPTGLNSPFEAVPPPPAAIVPLQQDQGGACVPRVKKNDPVRVGQLIGESPTPHGASIHAPVSGKVAEIIKHFPTLNGPTAPAVVIESDGLATPADPLAEEGSLAALGAAGVVDFDRPTVPLAAKLEAAAARRVTTLIVNALDSEPFLSSRGRLLLEQIPEITAGIAAIRGRLDLRRVILTVDARAGEAIAAARAAWGDAVEILPLKNRYPQAVDVLLVKRALNREVPFAHGVRIVDVGAVVLAVESLAAVGRRRPVVERFFTVAGREGHVKNVRVAIGTPIRAVLEHCGITPAPGGKIIAGGPMTGTAAAGPDLPVTKEVAGLTVQSPREVVAPVEAVCIKCGRCVDACPMGLMPFLLSGFAEKGMLAQAHAYDLFACIECGCCAYQCPVRIPMVQFIQFAKRRLTDQGGGT